MKIIISSFLIILLFSTALQSQPAYDYMKLQKEKLGRGVVAIRENPSEVVISWRYLSSDQDSTTFNLYRNDEKIANILASSGTFYKDKYQGDQAILYTVKPVVKGKESNLINGSYTLPANAPLGYTNISLDRPKDGNTPAGEHYTYSPNDA